MSVIPQLIISLLLAIKNETNKWVTLLTELHALWGNVEWGLFVVRIQSQILTCHKRYCTKKRINEYWIAEYCYELNSSVTVLSLGCIIPLNILIQQCVLYFYHIGSLVENVHICSVLNIKITLKIQCSDCYCKTIKFQISNTV